jgi:hypothetical protein
MNLILLVAVKAFRSGTFSAEGADHSYDDVYQVVRTSVELFKEN